MSFPLPPGLYPLGVADQGSDAQRKSSEKRKAREIPGSIPAAILILLGVVASIIDRTSGGAPAPILGGLIVGFGLLLGGPGFRWWGVFTHSAGLIVWPILLSTHYFGAVNVGEYIGLIGGNIAILLLLIGTPSRVRVWSGVGVFVLTLVAAFCGAIVQEAIGGRTPGASPQISSSPRPAPRLLSFQGSHGELTLTVPSELPDVELNTTSYENLRSNPHFASTEIYTGEEENDRLLQIIFFKMQPESIFNLDPYAQGALKGARKGVASLDPNSSVVKVWEKRTKVGGWPAVDLLIKITSDQIEGNVSYQRQLAFTNDKSAVQILTTARTRDEVEGEAVKQLLESIRIAPLPGK